MIERLLYLNLDLGWIERLLYLNPRVEATERLFCLGIEWEVTKRLFYLGTLGDGEASPSQSRIVATKRLLYLDLNGR